MTLAGKIREAAKGLKEFGAGDLGDAVGVQTYQGLLPVRAAVKHFLKRGEMERIAPGRYRYIKLEKAPTRRQRLWDVARRMIRFNLGDLEQITEIKYETIHDFTKWLVKAGYARRIKPGHFKVVKKLGPVVPRGEARSGPAGRDLEERAIKDGP